MRVRDVMTVRPVRILDGASVQRAVEILALSQASDVMVVDRDERFVGVLSEGDILRSALPDVQQILDEGGQRAHAFELFLTKAKALSDQSISPLVIREPLVVRPDDHIVEAAVILIERYIRRLPVVEEGLLVGTVSRQDIARAIVGVL
jgi:CBS domain-containing protein